MVDDCLILSLARILTFMRSYFHSHRFNKVLLWSKLVNKKIVQLRNPHLLSLVVSNNPSRLHRVDLASVETNAVTHTKVACETCYLRFAGRGSTSDNNDDRRQIRMLEATLTFAIASDVHSPPSISSSPTTYHNPARCSPAIELVDSNINRRL